ncbi:di-trans,poly-cis-decaprenylcistransferase [bacterium]|nr:di-trans,poly-cis-decaprenylcistransferase [bacterium]
MKHLAIIIDGNGRWAEKQGLSRMYGHEKGAVALENALLDLKDLDIEVLSVYAFSTENSHRSPMEVNNLMGIIAYFFNNNIGNVIKQNNYQVRFIGDLQKLPEKVLTAIANLNALAINNTGKLIVFALNYGGANEVCRAFDKIYAEKKFFKDDTPITEKQIYDSLDTANIALPDAILRYGGHKRLSNFMPLQSIYSELFFIDKLWPDYQKSDIEEIIAQYTKIKRNFGGINA